MLQTLILAVPLAVLWLILSREVTLPVFITGYIFGIGVMGVLRVNSNAEGDAPPMRITRIPAQLIAIVEYIIVLTVEIFVSGIDVARRVLTPHCDIQPTLLRLSTQDKTNNPVVTALSAHGITITPGTLVVDFEEADGETWMLVHTLDIRMTDEASQIAGQTVRVARIKRMLGL